MQAVLQFGLVQCTMPDEVLAPPALGSEDLLASEPGTRFPSVCPEGHNLEVQGTEN